MKIPFEGDNKMDKHAVNFEIPENIFLQLKQLAEDNDRSIASQIRTIIISYLKENNSDAPGIQN